jgi:hypothetical protein
MPTIPAVPPSWICASCDEATASDPCSACGGPSVLLGRYRLRVPLGRGAEGTTWEAEGPGGTVAIKQVFLRGLSPKDREMLAREGVVLSELQHPGIPTFIDAFEAGQGPLRSWYLVQSRADGPTLAAELARRRFTEGEVRAVMTEVLGILAYLHGLSPPVVHRDVKPANLICTPAGLVLVDFGSVRDALRGDLGGSTLTGTFGYMAPEQFHGDASPATDLYAVGALAVAMLTRREPHTLHDAAGELRWRDHAQVPAALGALLDALLARDPAARPPSADAVRRQLAEIGQAPTAATPLPGPPPASTDASRGALLAIALLAFIPVVGVATMWAAGAPATPPPAPTTPPLVLAPDVPAPPPPAPPVDPWAAFVAALRADEQLRLCAEVYPELPVDLVVSNGASGIAWEYRSAAGKKLTDGYFDTCDPDIGERARATLASTLAPGQARTYRIDPIGDALSDIEARGAQMRGLLGAAAGDVPAPRDPAWDAYTRTLEAHFEMQTCTSPNVPVALRWTHPWGGPVQVDGLEPAVAPVACRKWLATTDVAEHVPEGESRELTVTYRDAVAAQLGADSEIQQCLADYGAHHGDVRGREVTVRLSGDFVRVLGPAGESIVDPALGACVLPAMKNYPDPQTFRVLLGDTPLDATFRVPGAS